MAGQQASPGAEDNVPHASGLRGNVVLKRAFGAIEPVRSRPAKPLGHAGNAGGISLSVASGLTIENLAYSLRKPEEIGEARPAALLSVALERCWESALRACCCHFDSRVCPAKWRRADACDIRPASRDRGAAAGRRRGGGAW